jgi:ATP:corrinoid adenosyltransferase
MKYWVINQLECLPQDGDLKDFVVVAHWNRNAKEVVNEKEYQASVYGSVSFSKDNVTDFIPYDELTYEIVCGWLDNSLDVPALDANLDQQIENIINPPIITLPLPWAAPVVETPVETAE